MAEILREILGDKLCLPSEMAVGWLMDPDEVDPDKAHDLTLPPSPNQLKYKVVCKAKIVKPKKGDHGGGGEAGGGGEGGDEGGEGEDEDEDEEDDEEEDEWADEDEERDENEDNEENGDKVCHTTQG
mgnify:FL=1